MLQVRRDHDHVEVPRLSMRKDMPDRAGATWSTPAETQQEVRFRAAELRMLRTAYKRIDFSAGYPACHLPEDMTNACAAAVGRRYRDS